MDYIIEISIDIISIIDDRHVAKGMREEEGKGKKLKRMRRKWIRKKETDFNKDEKEE